MDAFIVIMKMVGIVFALPAVFAIAQLSVDAYYERILGPGGADRMSEYWDSLDGGYF